MDPTTQAWLELQCRFITSTRQAVVLLGTPGQDQDQYQVMAHWPHTAPPAKSLEVFCRSLLSQSSLSPKIKVVGDGEALISSPILVKGRCFGVIGLEVNTQDRSKLQQIQRLLVWGGDWFTWLAKERKSYRDQDDRLLGFIEMLALALKYDDLRFTAQRVVDALRRRLDCSRVSLSLVQGSGLQLLAISDSQSITELAGLVQPIRCAMEESLDQGCSIVLPDAEQTLITTAHQQLLAEHSLDSVCSIPMLHHQQVLGVITLEGAKAGSFQQTQLHFCEQAGLLLGPILQLKQQATRPSSLIQRLRTSSVVTKISLSIAGVVLVGTSVITTEHWVNAKAEVTSDSKQLVSVFQDGYLLSADARPGDRVAEGTVLASLDGRDLQLEYQKWQAKKAQFMKSYNSALGSQDRGAINISRAQLDQAEAQLSLIKNQLQRLQLKSPFDGIIVSGDYSQSLGAPVKRGDVLYEVAIQGRYRLRLSIDERDISYLALGQKGELLLASLPDQTFPFDVYKMTPIALAEAGNNYFIVEASIDGDQSTINPGMTGVAKVAVGQKSLLWQWTHRIVEQFSLWFWKL